MLIRLWAQTRDGLKNKRTSELFTVDCFFLLLYHITTMGYNDFKIQKLSAENYHAWSFSMKMYLIGKDLWRSLTVLEWLRKPGRRYRIEISRRGRTKHSLQFAWRYPQTCRSTCDLQELQRKRGTVSKNISTKDFAEEDILQTKTQPCARMEK